MNFNEITQYTGAGHYQINVGLKFFKQTIEDYQTRNCGKPLELNPDFQRGHVWTEKQQIGFIEYFLKGGKINPIYLNHPGWQHDYKGDFVCVDGLQRITAILRFLNNEIKAFDKFYSEFEGRCTHTFIININNLKTKKEVLQWYIELNSGGTPHTEDEIKKVKKMLEGESL